MAVCDYLYVSGLRVESGQAVVEIDGKRLRVVRNGKGASRTTLASENPPSDGEITLKDLQARLKASGAKTAEVTIVTPDGSFDATLDPARAMGRKGRTGDYAAALAGMDPASREIAARYQLRTLPYGEENASVAKARLSEVLRHVDVSACTTFLPPQFGKYAPADTVRTALDAAAPADALRFAAAAMTDDEFRSATDAAPLEALRHGLGRLASGGKELVRDTAIAAAIKDPADTFDALSALGPVLSLRQKIAMQREIQTVLLQEGRHAGVLQLRDALFDALEQDPTDRHVLAHLACFSEAVPQRKLEDRFAPAPVSFTSEQQAAFDKAVASEPTATLSYAPDEQQAAFDKAVASEPTATLSYAPVTGFTDEDLIAIDAAAVSVRVVPAGTEPAWSLQHDTEGNPTMKLSYVPTDGASDEQIAKAAKTASQLSVDQLLAVAERDRKGAIRYAEARFSATNKAAFMRRLVAAERVNR